MSRTLFTYSDVKLLVGGQEFKVLNLSVAEPPANPYTYTAIVRPLPAGQVSGTAIWWEPRTPE